MSMQTMREVSCFIIGISFFHLTWNKFVLSSFRVLLCVYVCFHLRGNCGSIELTETLLLEVGVCDELDRGAIGK